VVGVDNDMRQAFFGTQGSTAGAIQAICEEQPSYQHHGIDIRDRGALRDLIREVRPDFIVHTAAQPSHDKAAAIPYDDFDINAVGTLNVLVAARDYCADSPICFTSTNKVYGDRPNELTLTEHPTRYDYADGRTGIGESMQIDQTLHSLFGVSKVAADVLCQEFGRYFNMPVGIFRCGCITGPQHAAVELHGFLAYIVRCAVRGIGYTIYGYKGKQVRDQIHSDDVASLFYEFYKAPRSGEVYNLGGGRNNSISILETIEALKQMGFSLRQSPEKTNRKGDHICYISDLCKVTSHFPDWHLEHDITRILSDLARHQHDSV